MPRIEIVSANPRVVEEQIVVDVEATLYQEKEGDPDGGMRIPNITFEVRSSVANATGISSEKGYFAQKGILINTCEDEEQEAATAKLTISANYTEGDESKQVIEEITVDISEQLSAINVIKRARKEKEAARLAKEAEARKTKEAEIERKRLKQEMYERMEPDRKRQIKADITKAGEDIKNRERSQIDPFNVLQEHEDHPHAERTAIMVASEAPERTIEAVEIYKSTTWGSKVMKIAAVKQPLSAIKAIARYKDMDWAPEILRIATQRHPHEVVKALSQYCEYEWCKDIILHVAETAPQAAFEEVEMWEFYPWAEKAAIAAAYKAPECALNNLELYQDQPWARDIYKYATELDTYRKAKEETQRRAAEEARKRAAEEARKRAAEEARKREAEEARKRATEEARKRAAEEAQRRAAEEARQEKPIREIQNRIIGLIGHDSINNGNGGLLVEEFEELVKFQAHPLSRVVAMEVARNNPDVIFWLKHSIKDASWFLDVIGAAANQYLQTGITREFLYKKSFLSASIFGKELQMYKTEEWAEKLVLLAAEWHPPSASVNLEYYVDQPWAEKVLLLLLERDLMVPPETPFAGGTAFVKIDVYRDQPWAERFLERAKKADPIQAAKFSKCIYYRFEARRDSLENVFARVRQEPKVAIEFCRKYKDEPWADAVIKVAEQRIAELYPPPKPPPKMKTEIEKRKRDEPLDEEQSDKAYFPTIYRIKKFFGLYDD